MMVRVKYIGPEPKGTLTVPNERGESVQITSMPIEIELPANIVQRLQRAWADEVSVEVME